DRFGKGGQLVPMGINIFRMLRAFDHSFGDGEIEYPVDVEDAARIAVVRKQGSSEIEPGVEQSLASFQIEGGRGNFIAQDDPFELLAQRTSQEIPHEKIAIGGKQENRRNQIKITETKTVIEHFRDNAELGACSVRHGFSRIENRLQ